MGRVDRRVAIGRVKWAAAPRPPRGGHPQNVHDIDLEAPKMVAVLPLEVLQIVSRECPCRDAQIRAIATLYNVSLLIANPQLILTPSRASMYPLR